jgi:hypothetical protein
MTLANKATVVPLHYWDANDDCTTPIAITDAVSVENTVSLLRPEHFRLWKDQIAQKDRGDLARTRVSLVHRFSSEFHVGEPEKLSQEVAHRVFVCLRIIKPTRMRYAPIQLKWISPSEVDVFSFSHPDNAIANVPDAEVLNTLGPRDVHQVQEVLSTFLDVESKGSQSLRRAIRCYEQGYAETRDPAMQLIVWCMGIEALLGGNEQAAPPRAQRLLDALSPELNIYGEGSTRFQPWPHVPLGSLAGDLFALRDLFVHGNWVPEEWRKQHHSSIAGEPLSYADVLRDAAPFVLRKLIQHSLHVHSG